MQGVQEEAAAFFDGYRRAFEQRDAAAIAEHYAYPAHVTSDVGKVVLVPATSKEAWTKRVSGLLETYAQIGFSTAKVVDVQATALSRLLLHARVRWSLHGAGGELLYDFDDTYTLGRFDEGLRIVNAVSHNEIPHYRGHFKGRKPAVDE